MAEDGKWTLEALKHHMVVLLDERRAQLLGVLDERDRRMQERFEAAQAELGRLALQYAADKASANEWRGALEDNTRAFVTRREWETGHGSITDRLETSRGVVFTRISELDVRITRIESRQGYVSGALLISLVSLGVAVLVAIVGFFHLSH